MDQGQEDDDDEAMPHEMSAEGPAMVTATKPAKSSQIR